MSERINSSLKNLDLQGQSGLISEVYPIDTIEFTDLPKEDKNAPDRQITSFAVELSDLTKEEVLTNLQLENPDNEYDVKNTRMSFTHDTNIEDPILGLRLTAIEIELEVYNKTAGCYEAISLSQGTETKLLTDMENDENIPCSMIELLRSAAYSIEESKAAEEVERTGAEAESDTNFYIQNIDKLSEIEADAEKQGGFDAETSRKLQEAKATIADKAVENMGKKAEKLGELAKQSHEIFSHKQAPKGVPETAHRKIQEAKESRFNKLIGDAFKKVGNSVIKIMKKCGNFLSADKFIEVINKLPVPSVPDVIRNIRVGGCLNNSIIINETKQSVAESARIISNAAKQISEDIKSADTHPSIKSEIQQECEDVKYAADKVIKRMDDRSCSHEDVKELAQAAKSFNEKISTYTDPNPNLVRMTVGAEHRISAAVANLESSLSKPYMEMLNSGTSYEKVEQINHEQRLEIIRGDRETKRDSREAVEPAFEPEFG